MKKKKKQTYGLGSDIGGLLGTAAGLIPGLQPLAPLLGGAGQMVGGLFDGKPKPQANYARPTNNTNPYGLLQFAQGGMIPIEVEGDEVVEQMGHSRNVKGKSHAQGGVPMLGKKGGFVYSNQMGYDKHNKATAHAPKKSFADLVKKLDMGNYDQIAQSTKKQIQRDNNMMKSLREPTPVQQYGLGTTILPLLGHPAVQQKALSMVSDTSSSNNIMPTYKAPMTGLLSGIPSLVSGAIDAFAKPEREKPRFNTYEGQIKNLMSNRRVDSDAIFNRLNLSRNSQMKRLRDNARSYQNFQSRSQGVFDQDYRAKADTLVRTNQINNQYRAQEANTLNNLGMQRSREMARIDQNNAMNRANSRLARRNFFGDLTKFGQAYDTNRQVEDKVNQERANQEKVFNFQKEILGKMYFQVGASNVMEDLINKLLKE